MLHTTILSLGLFLYFYLTAHTLVSENHFPSRLQDILSIYAAFLPTFHITLTNLPVLLIGLLQIFHFLVYCVLLLSYQIQHLVQLCTT